MGPTRKSTANRRLLDEKEISHSEDGDDAKRSNSRKRKFSDMLGSRWATEELTLFYNSYRKYGKDWEKVASTLRNRSSEMVEALFMTNKVYLSLPHEHASATGLCAMMTDHYNNLVGNNEQERIYGASSSEKTKKLARGKVQPTSDEKRVLDFLAITSKYGFLELWRKKPSDIWPHPVRRRTPRFPVEFPYENGGEKYFGGDEVAREIAITLTEFSQKDGSPEVSQTPSRGSESPLRVVQRKHSIVERNKDGLLSAEVEKDFLDGRSGLQICNLSGYTPNTAESMDKGSVRQKGRTPDDDALQMLVDLSLMMPTENEDVLLPAHQQEIRPSGTNMKENLSSPQLRSSKISKPAKDQVFDICSISEENEDQRLSTVKTKRKKKKLPVSKVQYHEAHPDGKFPGIEVGDTKKKPVTDTCRKSARNDSPILIKNENLSSDNLTREGIDSAQPAVHDPEADQVNLPTSFRSRRKIKFGKPQFHKGFMFPHKTSDELSDLYSASSQDRASNMKEILSHCLSNQNLRRWCTFEWFYSPIDYPWFTKREFVDYLHHAGLGHVQNLTRIEWGVIKSSLGKPRRFSEQFLKGEKEKLNQYRESVRRYYSELREGVKEGLPVDLARPLSVGQHVIAIHPKTREIHDGTVLTVDHSKYRIQFHRHELGVEFVKDIECMPLPKDCRKLFPNLNNVEGISQLSSRSHSCLLKQTKSIRGPAHTIAHQQPMCYLPDTLDESKAKEADVQALSELTRALNRKEAIVLELRHMNDDVLEKEHGDSTLENLNLYKKQYAALLTQLNEANKQVSSALYICRERNTYHGQCQLTWPVPVTCVTDHDNSLSIVHESESHVNEIMNSSRPQAKIMVDAAVQAMSSFRKSEDTTDKIEEAVDYVNDQLPFDDFLKPLAPDSKPSKLSSGEAQIPSELISKCVATLVMIQKCTERQFPPSDVAQIIQHALTSLQPRSAQNLSVYTDIQRCMGVIRNQILALIPTESSQH